MTFHPPPSLKNHPAAPPASFPHAPGILAGMSGSPSGGRDALPGTAPIASWDVRTPVPRWKCLVWSKHSWCLGNTTPAVTALDFARLIQENPPL